jgi:hypothetical protein
MFRNYYRKRMMGQALHPPGARVEISWMRETELSDAARERERIIHDNSPPLWNTRKRTCLSKHHLSLSMGIVYRITWAKQGRKSHFSWSSHLFYRQNNDGRKARRKLAQPALTRYSAATILLAKGVNIKVIQTFGLPEEQIRE